MTDVEKVARAIQDEAVEKALLVFYDGKLTVEEMWRINGEDLRPAMRAAIEAALAAMGEREAKPVAWRYEIADAVIHNPDGSKTGANWRVIVAGIEPCVPGWGIRNLTPLYASPRPEAVGEADARDAARYRWLRDGNAYAPEENDVRGGEDLDTLCDEEMAAAIRSGT